MWPGNSQLQHVESSSLQRLKPGPRIVSAESEPLDHQGSPQGDSFLMLSPVLAHLVSLQVGAIPPWGFGAFPGAFGLGRAQPQRRGTSP